MSRWRGQAVRAHELTIHSPSSTNHHGYTITEQMRQSYSGWFGLSNDKDDKDNGDLKSAFAYDEWSESSLCYSSNEEDNHLSTVPDGDGQLLGLEFKFASGYISADDEDDSSFADTNKIEYDKDDVTCASSRHFHWPQLKPIDMELVQTTHRPVYSSDHGCVLADDTNDALFVMPAIFAKDCRTCACVTWAWYQFVWFEIDGKPLPDIKSGKDDLFDRWCAFTSSVGNHDKTKPITHQAMANQMKELLVSFGIKSKHVTHLMWHFSSKQMEIYADNYFVSTVKSGPCISIPTADRNMLICIKITVCINFHLFRGKMPH